MLGRILSWLLILVLILLLIWLAPRCSGQLVGGEGSATAPEVGGLLNTDNDGAAEAAAQEAAAQEAAAQEAAAQEAAAQEAAAQEAAAQEAAAQEAAAQEAAAQEVATQEVAAQEAAAEASKAAQLAKAADEAAKMGSGSSIILEGVTFGNASDVLTADVQEILSGVVETLKNNPGMLVEVAGYTDSRGAKAMNVELSQRRAQSVVNFLVERGVPASQMTAKGYGPESPVADNGTAQGRAQNRRVEMHVK